MSAILMADESSRVLTIRVFPAANADAPEVFPVEATLDDTWPVAATATIRAAGLPQADPSEYGRQLGEALFASPSMQRQFNFARGRGPHVSIGLQIDADALGSVAWERLLYVGAGEELALATSSAVALTRRAPSELQEQEHRTGPFRLLLVLASPSTLQADGPIKPIAVADEVRSLRCAWDAQVGRGLLHVSILGRLPEALAQELARAGYRVVQGPATLDALANLMTELDGLHLVSHGSFKNGTASLLLEDADGQAAIVSEKDFLAKVENSSLRLVFLQACQSATGQSKAMSGLAPKVAARTAAVVAMQDFVRMEDATRFAQEFYDVLLSTGYVDRAVNAGRQALFAAGPGNANWAIPCLYLAPKAACLWRPDEVLLAVQDLADVFRRQPEVQHPFPVEVVRYGADDSPWMETSPPGPRVRVLDAVAAAFDPGAAEPATTLVIAGNYGRAKSAQLRSVYTSYARRVSRDKTSLPLYVQVSDFPLADDAPERLLARAIETTYRKFDVDLRAAKVLERFDQPFMLCVDGDDGGVGQRLAKAFECLRAIAESRPHASAVVTLDLEQLEQVRRMDPAAPAMLVQLLSPATVAQHLSTLAASDAARAAPLTGLLAAIQKANLFDVASVPWLLSYLIRHAGRGLLSRSAMIGRIVDEHFAAADLSAGVRRLVLELLGRIAWHLQTRQIVRLDGAYLYEVLDQVRGHRELQLEEFKTAALKTRVLAPTDDDGVRFSYPGFQSYFCARHLLEMRSGLGLNLDDITATLGRRSRVRLWEDTLVLLAGMTGKPDDLVGRVLAGSGTSHAEPAFLAARCLHEAGLAKHEVSKAVTTQVLDNLIWRSTPRKESSAAVRIQATECLGLLADPATIPHLFSIAVERVRPRSGGAAEFELSGLRHAAMRVLLTMADQTARYVLERATNPSATATEAALKTLIEQWQTGDCEGLRQMFRATAVDGLPAIIAFALATLGTDENQAFLTDEILNPRAASDTRWSIADSLLHFNPVSVTQGAIARMREVKELHPHAAYMIGRLRVASPTNDETRFLVTSLSSADAKTQGMALRALAQLGNPEYRELCQWIATEDWASAKPAIGVPNRRDRGALRFYALESLRIIGDKGSLEALREARTLRSRRGAYDRREGDLIQLSYEVSEDVYCRVSSQAGDSSTHARQ